MSPLSGGRTQAVHPSPSAAMSVSDKAVQRLSVSIKTFRFLDCFVENQRFSPRNDAVPVCRDELAFGGKRSSLLRLCEDERSEDDAVQKLSASIKPLGFWIASSLSLLAMTQEFVCRDERERQAVHLFFLVSARSPPLAGDEAVRRVSPNFRFH